MGNLKGGGLNYYFKNTMLIFRTSIVTTIMYHALLNPSYIAPNSKDQPSPHFCCCMRLTLAMWPRLFLSWLTVMGSEVCTTVLSLVFMGEENKVRWYLKDGLG